MKLSDVIVSDAIVPALASRTRDEAIAELAEALVQAGAVPQRDRSKIIEKVLEREAQATTGIGKGVALPHAKPPGIKQAIATIGLSREGIDFAALDAKAVYVVIFLLSSPDNPDEHLQAMETIFKQVQRDMFRKLLRQCETKQDIVELIHEADEMG